MWTGRRSTGNSSLEIQLRQKKVLANRERVRISRAATVLERHWSQNFRKLSSLERSLFVLMGKDPYPHCSREEALFEYNQPGFCYRRDGTPRYLRALHESKSRKIVNDLEGREGLVAQPAINVVSDNPHMAEILSSPELVQILCELRNTAAIMSDEGLFAQFATILQNSSRNPLIGFEGPLDYLKEYRKNLIQEFFDSLETETEMNYFMGKANPNPSLSLNRVEEPILTTEKPLTGLVDGSELATRRQSATGLNNASNFEEWNKAVVEGLKRAQEEEIMRKFGGGKTTAENDDGIWTLQRFIKDVDNENLPSLYSDKGISLLTSKYLEESRKELKTPVRSTSTAISAPSTTPTTPHIHSDQNKKAQTQKRVEFDNFVRHLISKIQILDEMGQDLLVFQRKRPDRHASLIDPLVKLLKKQSLFSSLTDADILSLDKVSSADPGNDPPKKSLSSRPPPVKYFKVPQSPGPDLNDTELGSKSTVFTSKTGRLACNSNATTNFSQSSFPSKKTSNADTDIFLQAQQKLSTLRRSSIVGSDLQKYDDGSSAKHVHFKEGVGRSTTNSVSFKSTTTCNSVPSTTGNYSEASSCSPSMRRVRCHACREKVKQVCTQMQQRDAIVSKSKDAYAWKIPEMSNWPHEYKELPAGIRARESVRSLSEIRRKEKMANSVYLIPAPKSIRFQKGAPTPRLARRSTMLPDFSAFSFQNQSLKFGDDFLNTFQIGEEQPKFGSGMTEDPPTLVVMPSKGIENQILADGSRSKMGLAQRPSSAGSGSSVASGVKRSKSGFGGGVGANKSVHSDSWTLQVSKLDIMKLRHELETLQVRDKMLEFEHKFLSS